jgi:phosphatidylglycerol:prolipoprotein diacylglycerol transferase
MWPRIGPFPTFGIMYLTGIILHFVVSWRVAKRYGLKRRVWIAASVCYLVGMTLGAKLLFDLRHGSPDVAALFRSEHYLQGGLWGGLLAYLAMAVPAVLLLAQDKRSAMDLLGLSIPIPWIAAKLGCLLHGDCYGKPCSLPWAVTFPEGAHGAPAGIPLHPTQLYEVGIMLIILLVFARLTSDRWRGTRLLWFLLVYGFGRAATDFLRGDTESYLYPGLLTLTQLLCAIAGAGALLVLVLLHHKQGRPVRPAPRIEVKPEES